MKENLQDKLVEILSGIQGAVAKGSDFVLTQLPDVAQQYVAFGRIWCFVDLAFCSVMLYVAYRLIKYAITSKKTDGLGDWAPSRVVSIVVGGIGGAGAFFTTACTMRGAFLVWFAPKVWLLTEIANLVSHK